MSDTAKAPTLLVLAAGMGSRFGGMKQVAPVNEAGEAILDYSVYDAMRAGFGRVVFVVREEMEASFRESIGAKFAGHIDVGYALQRLESLPEGFRVPEGRTKPWGTLQATLMAADLIDGPFAVINADDFYGAESFRVLAEQLRSESGRGAMVGYPLRQTLSEFGAVSRGLCEVSADGMLQGIVERTKIVRDGSGAKDLGNGLRLTGDEMVSMNMWGFEAGIFTAFRKLFIAFLERSGSDLTAEAYLPEAVNSLVAAGELRVDVLPTSARWCGITYREDYPLVKQCIREMTQAGAYPARLWS